MSSFHVHDDVDPPRDPLYNNTNDQMTSACQISAVHCFPTPRGSCQGYRIGLLIYTSILSTISSIIAVNSVFITIIKYLGCSVLIAAFVYWWLVRKRIRATPWNIYFEIADIVILIYRLIITTIRNQKEIISFCRLIISIYRLIITTIRNSKKKVFYIANLLTRYVDLLLRLLGTQFLFVLPTYYLDISTY